MSTGILSSEWSLIRLLWKITILEKEELVEIDAELSLKGGNP